MESRAHRFRELAREALRDGILQQALGRSGTGFVARRAAAVAELPDFEALRRRRPESS